jgi:single-stranded-DNA-specific exonuclease
MRTVILTHSDADGMCSGAILLSAFPKAEIFFTKPVSLLDDLKHIRADQILISDMALNKRDAPEIIEEMKNKKIVFYCDEHPHPDNINPDDLKRLCEVYIHQEGVSSSEISYQYFQNKIPRERVWIALYGAIADYAGETDFVKERLRNWDARALYFEVSTLVMGIKMDAFNNYDAKREIVKLMARGGNPSDMFGLVNAAKSAVSKEFDIYAMVKKRAESAGQIGYVLDLPYFGFRGPTALFSATVTNRPIGMSAHTRMGHIDITLRCRKSIYPLHKLAEKASMKVGGSGGGIPEAAGARIPKNQFDVFLKEANLLLKKGA